MRKIFHFVENLHLGSEEILEIYHEFPPQAGSHSLLTDAASVHHFESLEAGANPRGIMLHVARLLTIMLLSAQVFAITGVLMSRKDPSIVAAHCGYLV